MITNEDAEPSQIEDCNEVSQLKNLNNSVNNFRANAFWFDEKKIRRAVEIFGSVVPRKRALEMISEEAGISIRLAKNFGSKLLNSNEFDEYIKELHNRPNGKEIYCYFNHMSNNKKYYDLNKSLKSDIPDNKNSNGSIVAINENNDIENNNDNLIYFNDEYDEDDEEDIYFNNNNVTNGEYCNQNDYGYNNNNNNHMASNLNQNNTNNNNINASNSAHSNEINLHLNSLNNKLDFIVTNLKQTNSYSRQIEPVNVDSNENIFLSSDMYKSLMQCKNCSNEFTISLYPKRAAKCGHSICFKCFMSKNESKNENLDALVDCPICKTSTTWSRNMDLITILEEVHQNRTKHYLAEIERIKVSRLSEHYSENFNDLLKLASDDIDKLSSLNQKLLFNLIKRKFNKLSQAQPNSKRTKI